MMAWLAGLHLPTNLGIGGAMESPLGLLVLLILGFTLSLDNFRVSIALGALRPHWRRALWTALAFGFWDGLSPLIGGMIGRYVGREVDSAAETLGPIVLAGYGLYLAVRSLWDKEPAELDERWAIFGLPFVLSIDNLLTGAGLGLTGVAPVVSAVLFGFCTFLMALVGLHLGKIVARFVPIRSDLLAGIGLLLTAGTLMLGHDAV